MLRRLLLPAVVFAAAVSSSGTLGAQSPSEFYDQNCAGCHTIGQGAGAGPDLRDVTRRRDREWLIRFLLDPDDFKSDPGVAKMIQEAGGLEMPATEGLTREMAIALLQIIEQRSATATGATGAPGATKVAPYGGSPQPATAADVEQGRSLFTGRARLIAKGPACVQCHDTATLAAPGGGRMGPDLTQAHARLGGTRGLAAWLQAAPTPVMKAVYRSAALTPDEARLLAAFFEDAARAQAPAPARAQQLIGAALSLSVAVLGLMGLLGSGRFRGVRAAMVARATRRPAAPGGSR